MNPIQSGINKAISAFDVRHNLEISYMAPLPLEKVLPGPRTLTQGWTLSGITRLTTGMPVTLFNNDDTSLIGSMPNGINNNGVDTPNYLGGNLHLNRNPRQRPPGIRYFTLRDARIGSDWERTSTFLLRAWDG